LVPLTTEADIPATALEAFAPIRHGRFGTVPFGHFGGLGLNPMAAARLAVADG